MDCTVQYFPPHRDSRVLKPNACMHAHLEQLGLLAHTQFVWQVQACLHEHAAADSAWSLKIERTAAVRVPHHPTYPMNLLLPILPC